MRLTSIPKRACAHGFIHASGAHTNTETKTYNTAIHRYTRAPHKHTQTRTYTCTHSTYTITFPSLSLASSYSTNGRIDNFETAAGVIYSESHTRFSSSSRISCSTPRCTIASTCLGPYGKKGTTAVNLPAGNKQAKSVRDTCELHERHVLVRIHVCLRENCMQLMICTHACMYLCLCGIQPKNTWANESVANANCQALLPG